MLMSYLLLLLLLFGKNRSYLHHQKESSQLIGFLVLGSDRKARFGTLPGKVKATYLGLLDDISQIHFRLALIKDADAF